MCAGAFVCISVRKRLYTCVCARYWSRERERERGVVVREKKPDCCVSGSLCVDLGRRLLYITFKADNIIA